MKEFFCRLFTPWRAGAQFDAPEAFYGFLLARNKLLGIIRNLCFGAALAQALGKKRGINRYGSILLPMDEALILCAVDLSGRPCLRYTADIPSQKVGDFDTELAREFFQAVVNTSLMSLHIRQLDGLNSHHIIEGMFKALGRALRQAVAVTGGALPSTKGVL